MKSAITRVVVIVAALCCCNLSTAKAQGVSEVTKQIAILQATTARAEYVAAFQAYDKALAAVEEHNKMLAALGEKPDQETEDLVHLVAGELYFQTGSYKEGYAMLEQVKSKSMMARKDIQQSRMLCGQGRYDEAITMLRRAQETNMDSYFDNIIIQNIGYIYWAKGDLTSADSYMAQAQQNMQHNRDKNYYVVLENRAMVHSLQGRQEAVAEIGEAMNFFESNSDNYQISLRKYGEILARADRAEAAKPYFERYFKLMRGKIETNLSNMTRQQRLNLWAKERPLLSKCFMLEDEASDFIFEVAMFRRQLSLVGNDDYAKLLSATPSQVRASLKDNEAAVEIIRYTSKDGEDWYAAIVLSKHGSTRFVKLLKVDDLYEPEVIGGQSIYNVIKREEPLEIDQLYSDKALGDRVWAPILAVLPSKVQKIYFTPEGIFNMWGIENMPFSNMGNIELRRVSSIALLINREARVAESFDKASKLIVGGLDYDSAILDPSGHAPDREARELLTELTGCHDGFFGYLKGTFAESETIAKMYNLQAKHQAGELTIKSIMSNYGIIHIATHGYSLSSEVAPMPEFMLDSLRYDRSLATCGVALSGANVAVNEHSEDGILSAKEICELDLSNVELVVLSACQTAKGDVMDDGTAGLVRGLKSAGAKSILATLWSINDNSTLLFMKEFYKQLSSGKTPYEAMRYAQNSLMKTKYFVYRRKLSAKTLASDREMSKEELNYNKPYHYAPFILIDAIE